MPATTSTTRPHVPPPAYDPHLVAKAIVFAAEHQRREITVGFGGWVIGAMGKVAPRLTDKAMEWTGYRLADHGPARAAADARQPLSGPRRMATSIRPCPASRARRACCSRRRCTPSSRRPSWQASAPASRRLFVATADGALGAAPAAQAPRRVAALPAHRARAAGNGHDKRVIGPGHAEPAQSPTRAVRSPGTEDLAAAGPPSRARPAAAADAGRRCRIAASSKSARSARQPVHVSARCASLCRMNAIRTPRRHPCSSRRRHRRRPGQGHARSRSPCRRWPTRTIRRCRRRSCSAARATPAPICRSRSIGSYARGCVAGAAAIPVDGENWQVMRLSRNRNWGHPQLIGFLQRFATRLPEINGWPGLLVGDISQPRGGPMLTGHASHQIGLDADIWLTPMPQPPPVAGRAGGDVGHQHGARATGSTSIPPLWTPQHTALIRAAATERERRAHLRQPGDQEGALPRGRRGPRAG